METKIKKQISFAVAQEKRKRREITRSPTKQVQDLYVESYKILIKDVKENLINIETYQEHGLRESIYQRCQFCPKGPTGLIHSYKKSQ